MCHKQPSFTLNEYIIYLQVFGKDYQPDHIFDHVHNAEMLDIPERGTPDFTVKPQTEIFEIPDISDEFRKD